MGNIGTLILVTTIAGAVGTGLGGVVGALIYNVVLGLL